MTVHNNIIYGEVDLDFDVDLFTEEFDSRIMPYVEPFVAVHHQWSWMPQLNKHWKIIPEEQFQKFDKIIKSGGTSFDTMTHYWSAVNLMRSPGSPMNGVGAGWRSVNRFKENLLKDQFKDLKILNWIQNNIPSKKIVGIHCVTVAQGQFATIHRDSRWSDNNTPNPAANNGFFKEGFIVLCLNVTNGGVPLLSAMDHEKEKPRSIDAKCYIGNDYFLHAVPLTSSRRRQIRISFLPDKKFYDLIKSDTIITIPDDYFYS
jgi:hypothetical protein